MLKIIELTTAKYEDVEDRLNNELQACAQLESLCHFSYMLMCSDGALVETHFTTTYSLGHA